MLCVVCQVRGITVLCVVCQVRGITVDVRKSVLEAHVRSSAALQQCLSSHAAGLSAS